MELGRPELLPDDYYLANFHSLVGFVYDTYQDLLTEAERNWYESFTQCDNAAQRLYVRLLTRKGLVFRLSRLKYPEILSLDNAATQLAEQGLSVITAPPTLPVLLSAYTKPELISLLSLQHAKSKSRVDLISLILESNSADQQQYLRTLQSADSWIAIEGHAFWNLYVLCFFGNLYQDSSEFVLRDLGAVQYESYAIPKDCRAFTSREQIDAHMRYFECASLWDTINKKSVEELHSLLAQLPASIPNDSHLHRRLSRLQNSIARQLERIGELADALIVFTRSSLPPARERSVRIHLAQGTTVAASELLDQMLLHPHSEAELQVAIKLQKQVAKAAGKPVKSEPRFRPDTSTLTLTKEDDRVEIVAQRFYSRLGTCGYTENCLVNGVLGLFIWDIIFHPINGAFYNPFQFAPSDFYDSDFKIKREELLRKRFAELDEPLRFSARIMENFSVHQGKSNPLVRWGGLSYELLSIALQRVPVKHWQAMFDRILFNPRENMAGFPDLVLFKSNDDDYEFIEIKGPGDTVQQNQLRWMQYFSKHRIPCRVVNIRWAVDHSVSTGV